MTRTTLLCLPLALLIAATSAEAANYSFATYTWDQDDTPDVLGLLGNNQSHGGVTFSNGFPTTITRSVGFVATGGTANSGFTGEPGFLPELSLGRQATDQHGLTQTDGTGALFAAAVNLPAGNDGSSARHGLEASWSGGRALPNLAGPDFVLYESGSNSTSPEGIMVRARDAASGQFSPWFYQAVDAFQIYTETPTPAVTGAFATAYDLTDLGVVAGNVVDLIQIANLMPGDRIDLVGAFAAQGEVIFSDTTGTLARPSVGSLPGLNPDSTFSSGGFDPDPLYIGALHAAVPEPSTLALSLLGLLLMGWRVRRRARA